MKLFNAPLIQKFIRKHRDAERWLTEWMQDVQTANWNNLMDVRRTYPSADGVALGRDMVVTVFNVKGNEYRLLTQVGYADQTVLVLDVLTHAQYSRNLWKKRW